MNPRLAKELYDKIEIIALSDKKVINTEKISAQENILSLANNYKKDAHLIARTIVQIRKNGTYKENRHRYK